MLNEVKRVLKEIFTEFFIIFGCVTVFMMLSAKYNKLAVVDLNYMFYILFFSFLGALPCIILTVCPNASEKAMLIRRIIHFVVLQSIIIIGACVIDVVDSFLQAVYLFIQISLIYIIVNAFSYSSDKKLSDKINEKLKNRILH